MNLFDQLKIAVSAYGRSISFVNQNKLWGWFIVPAVINLILFFVLGWFAWMYSGDLTDYIVNLISITDEDTVSILFWTVLIVTRLLVTLIFFFIYKYLLLILFSPALALFADRLYAIQTGHDMPFNLKNFINNVIRGISIAIKNLIKEGALTILFMLLSFTGIFVPFVPFLIFILQSYYYGFSMMDYRCELMGLGVKASSDFVWKNKGLALGNGAIFNLILLIPVFGVLIGPMLSLVSAFLAIEKAENITQPSNIN